MILQPLTKGTTQTTTSTSKVLAPLGKTKSTPLPTAKAASTPISKSKPISTDQSLIGKAKSIGSQAFNTGAAIGGVEVGAVKKVAKTPIIGQTIKLAQDTFDQAKQFIKSVPKETKEIVKHPAESTAGFALGAGKAITDFAISTKKTISNIQNGIDTAVYDSVGYKPPKNWDPRQNRDVVVKSLESFQKKRDDNFATLGKDVNRGIAVGNFIGSFIPYTVAGELATASIGAKLATPTIVKFIPQAAKFASTIGNAIGFLGVGQIEYDKSVDGKRVDKLKNDLIMLGLFEAGGVLAKGLTKGSKNIISKVVSKASKDIKGKGADITALEQDIKNALEEVRKDTKKDAGVVLANNMAKASDNEIKLLETKTQSTQNVEKYVAKHGNIVDSDRAKEIIPGYTPDKAPEFHKQSQQIRDQVYGKLLAENKGKGTNTVHFTAGGAASGKSESISDAISKDHSIIYDTTLSSPARVADVKKALTSGFNVNIDYTASDPIAAWKRVQKRGRKIPLESFARDYEQSLEQVKNLYNEYKNSPNVSFTFTDNRGKMGEAKIATFDEINKIVYNKDRILNEIQNSENKTRITSPGEQISKDNAGQPQQRNETKVSPRETSVPREQLPVKSEGVEKASRLEARVTQSLDKTPQEIKDQLGSTYTQMSKPEQITKATKFVTENPDDAISILRGEKEAPAGLLKNSIYVAMENQAIGDVELARKLASLASTRAGQELSILTEINPNSPVKAIRDVINVREQAFAKRFKKPVSEVIKAETDKIKTKIKVPDKYDWNNFVQSLKC